MHWTVHLDGGPRRVNHAAVAVKDKIYSFGGYCTGEDYKSTRPIDVHVLDTTVYQWRELPTPSCVEEHLTEKPVNSTLTLLGIPFRRYGHTAVARGDQVYIWGGRNDEESCNTLFCFDTNTHSWETPPVLGMKPTQRDGHSACLIDDKMYIFGGYEDEIGRFSQDTYSLDLKTLTWKYVNTYGTPPSPRDFHTATALGTRMYIFGGRGGPDPGHTLSETYDKTLIYLDTETMTWHWVIPKTSISHFVPSTGAVIPHGRRSLSAFAYKENLYIFGGYNGLMDRHFNDIHMFSPQNEMWYEIKPHGQRPSRRRRQQCILVNDRLFVFGGTSPEEQHVSLTIMEGAEEETRLIDHNDLHILDFAPTLQVLCLLSMINNKLNQPLWLPPMIKLEWLKMTSSMSSALHSSG